MQLDNELVRIKSSLTGYKTVQSTYSDSAKLYKATFTTSINTYNPSNPGSYRNKKFLLRCLTSVPLENAVFQLVPQPGMAIQVLSEDVNPLTHFSNVFYWYQWAMPESVASTDNRYFATTSVTILSNVPFELSVSVI